MRLFLEEHPLTNQLTSLQLHCTAPERPALVVELATGLRIRVRLGEHPLLHARVHPAYDGVWLLRSPAVFTVRSVPPGRILTRAQIQNLNEILIRACSPTTLTTKTRAYPLAGGSARWNAEVSERLRSLNIPAVPGLVDEIWMDTHPRFRTGRLR